MRVALVTMPVESKAEYDPDLDLIKLSSEELSQLLRHDGRNADELLADPALVERYALLVAPTFIHEATHARQCRLLKRRGHLDSRLHQQAMEVEALSFENSFARIHAARSPEAWEISQLPSYHPELGRFAHSWKPLEGVTADVRRYYNHLGNGHQAWIERLKSARAPRAGVLQPSLLAAKAELARRGRLPVAERLAYERGGDASDRITRMKTSVLRLLVAVHDRSSRTLTDSITAANDEIMANARRALRSLYALRTGRPTAQP